MADSIREKIVKDVVAALKDITTAGGYAVAVKAENVQRHRKGLAQVTSFPTLLVVEENEDVDVGPVGQGTLGTFTRKLRLRVTIYVRQHDKTSEEANKALAAVEKRLMVDPGRGGNALDTNLTGNENFVDDETEPRGGIDCILEVWYRTLRGDPYTVG